MSPVHVRLACRVLLNAVLANRSDSFILISQLPRLLSEGTGVQQEKPNEKLLFIKILFDNLI